MNKTVLIGIIVILLVAIIGVGFFAFKERQEKEALGMKFATSQHAMMSPTPRGPRPSPFLKGSTFTNNPLSSKTYLIAPVTGAFSTDTQKALTGWTIASVPQSDGSTHLTLTPKEAEDVQQSFTVKPGYKLYFLEMTLVDDATGVDENRSDDMGILVDPNGIVQ